MSRRAESPYSSCQPGMIFSAADNERGFAAAGGGWSPRCYACSFCGREFNSAQALGGHMNIHRRDRARLRTSTSLPSIPSQSESMPDPPNMPKSAHPTPYQATFREKPTSIPSNITIYPAPPTITSATPPFKLVDMRPAVDPALVALAAHPSHDQNLAASFVAPLMDLVPNRSVSTRSSATSFSKIQHEAQFLFPSIFPHASSFLIRPRIENASLKSADALNHCTGQASEQVYFLRGGAAAAAGGAQLIESSQAKGHTKRARGNAPDTASSFVEAKCTAQHPNERSSNSTSSMEKSSSLQAMAEPGSCGGPTHDSQGLNSCLDLELRLGQRSPSHDSTQGSAGNCCVRTTARHPP